MKLSSPLRNILARMGEIARLLASLIAPLVTIPIPLSAVSFPTLVDNVRCSRLRLSGEDVAVSVHGSASLTGSLEIMWISMNGPAAVRLTVPDSARASDCWPVEDTDLIAVIPPAADELKVYRLSRDLAATYQLDLVASFASGASTLYDVRAVAGNGLAAVVSSSDGLKWLRSAVGAVSLDAYAAGVISGGLITVKSVASGYQFSDINGLTSFTAPNTAAYAFDRFGALWVASSAAGLEKRSMPNIGTVEVTSPLTGFQSISRVLVSPSGRGVVIGYDDAGGGILARFDGTGARSATIQCEPWMMSCSSIDKEARYGMTNGDLGGGAMLLDIVNGVTLGPPGGSGPLRGEPFICDSVGNLFSVRAHFYADVVELTAVDRFALTRGQNADVTMGRPAMISRSTGLASFSATVGTASNGNVNLTLRGATSGVGFDAGVLRSINLTANIPVDVPLTVTDGGAHLVTVDAQRSPGTGSNLPNSQPILVAAEAGHSLPPARLSELSQTYADTLEGLLDPRIINALLDLPVTAFNPALGAEGSARYSNPHEWTLWLQTLAVAARTRPELWSRVSNGMRSMLALMKNPSHFDAVHGIWKSHYYTLKDDFGADHSLAAVPVRDDGASSSDDLGLSVHNVWLIMSVALQEGQPETAGLCAAYLSQVNVAWYRRTDGHIAQTRTPAGAYGGSNFDTRSAEGWLILTAMASLGQISHAELIASMGTLRAETALGWGTAVPAGDFDSGLFLRILQASLGHPVTPDEAPGSTAFLGTVALLEANRQLLAATGYQAPWSPAMDTGVEWDAATMGYTKPVQLRGPANMDGAPPTNPRPTLLIPLGHATASAAPFAAFSRLQWCPDSLREWSFGVLDAYRADYYISGLGWISSFPFRSSDPFPGYDGKRIGLLNSCYIATVCQDALNPGDLLVGAHPGHELLAAMTTAMDTGMPDSLAADLPIPVIPPVVIEPGGDANEISPDSAILTVGVVSGVNGANVAFEYGTTVAYGTVTAAQSVSPGLAEVEVSLPIEGLIPNTTYHFRALASSSGGTIAGPDLNFTTPRRFGSIAFGTAYSEVLEGGSAVIPVVRALGSDGEVSVMVSVTGGTATSGVDYSLTSTSVTFPEGTSDGAVELATFNLPMVSETNESVVLTLQSPQGGASLGGLASTTLRIIDSSADSTRPRIVLRTPSALARIAEEAGPEIHVTGTANDNKGVDQVLVSVNGGPFASVPLLDFERASTRVSFDFPVLAVDGRNLVLVKCIDTAGRESLVQTRSFDYIRPRVLLVGLGGPSNGGRISSGFAPSSIRTLGNRYSIGSTPGRGYVFDGWTANDFTGTGVTDDTRHMRTLSFTMVEGLELTANFIANPFPALAARYNGLVLPSGGTLPGINANGFVTATVSTNGAVSGRLTLDGAVLPFNGVFDSAGIGRFGATMQPIVSLVRRGKPTIDLALTLDMGAGDKITGTTSVRDGATVLATSDFTADRAVFSSKNLVDGDYTPLGRTTSASGKYTLVFPAVSQALALDGGTALTPADYPQGSGYGFVTLRATGLVSLSGVLADGTAVSASAPLSGNYEWPFFKQLYSVKGCVGGIVKFDRTQTDSDLAKAGCFWLRPVIANQQHYPQGWPAGISVDLLGSLYAAQTGSSVLPGLGLADGDGNADLDFMGGLLSPTVHRTVAVSSADRITNTPADTTFRLAINRTTGLISGTFTDSNGKKPPFRGVILQKGANAGGWGYFLSVKPRPVDGLGQSGSVTLSPQ